MRPSQPSSIPAHVQAESKPIPASTNPSPTQQAHTKPSPCPTPAHAQPQPKQFKPKHFQFNSQAPNNDSKPSQMLVNLEAKALCIAPPPPRSLRHAHALQKTRRHDEVVHWPAPAPASHLCCFCLRRAMAAARLGAGRPHWPRHSAKPSPSL